MKLNCDLGESFGAWKMQADGRIMPLIDMASIACGFHAGDPAVIAQAIQTASAHGVQLGAHPSYPDLQGFGRRSMAVPAPELRHMLHYQIAALEGMARVQGNSVTYVKPHGALYNDMMKDDGIFATVIEAIAQYPSALTLVIQALPEWQEYQRLASDHQVPLMFEAFADRRYQQDGRLTSRNTSGAVLNASEMIEQAKILVDEQSVITDQGKRLRVKADTLCVHGDTPDAVEGVKAIRTMLG